MPSHLRPIVSECDEPGCKSRATHAFYSTFNERIGQFCKRHAERRLKAEQADEKRAIALSKKMDKLA